MNKFLTALDGKALYVGSRIYTHFQQRWVEVLGIYVDPDGDVYLNYTGGQSHVNSCSWDTVKKDVLVLESTPVVIGSDALFNTLSKVNISLNIAGCTITDAKGEILSAAARVSELHKKLVSAEAKLVALSLEQTMRQQAETSNADLHLKVENLRNKYNELASAIYLMAEPVMKDHAAPTRYTLFIEKLKCI